MHTDWRGLPVSGADAATTEAIAVFQQDFQDFSDRAAAVMDLAEAEPGCLAAQLYAAGLATYSQVSADIARDAGPPLERASGLLEAGTERERVLHRAVSAWSASDYPAAKEAFETLLERWPQDITSIKFAEFVFFEAPDYPRHLRLMERASAANAELPAFGAMWAFAHELNGHTARAEAIATEALSREPDTPWADHALSHVYLNSARLEEGRAFLTTAAARWDGHSQGIRGHNAWHLALIQLAAMDVEGAVATWRRFFDGMDPTSAFEHTDAISLLWRLELCGVEVAEADWARFAPLASERVADRVMPFLDAHYAYALARAGEAGTARRAVATLRHEHGSGADEPWRTGVPLLDAVIDLGDGDPASCVRRLEPLLSTLACVGGSDAQNDLFLQSYLVALRRSGRARQAEEALRRRIGERAPTPQEEAWLAA